ncbi:MAG: ribonuclease M5 [Emergencia sp.]
MQEIQKKKIKEAIIVEGRDDTAAIQRAVDAVTIETHGFGMPDTMWPLIEKAYNTQGVILFTDPDYAGEKIRRLISDRFPDCKQAFLPKGKALKGSNIGVENAKPEDIVEALENARCTDSCQTADLFTVEDLVAWGLAGTTEAKERRERLGNRLSIGYGNSKAFLRKLNQFGISREEFLKQAEDL